MSPLSALLTTQIEYLRAQFLTLNPSERPQTEQLKLLLYGSGSKF
jgi:hypothetical protein